MIGTFDVLSRFCNAIKCLLVSDITNPICDVGCVCSDREDREGWEVEVDEEERGAERQSGKHSTQRCSKDLTALPQLTS